MTDDTLSAAIREAYAVAPADVVILDTLELRHPEFVDDQGRVTAVRVVRNYADTDTWLRLGGAAVAAVLDRLSEEDRSVVGLVARLEPDAPLDAGCLVPWIALAFKLEQPARDSSPEPELVLSLDVTDQKLHRYLEVAAMSQSKVAVTYRPYLSNDISGPQQRPPVTFDLTEVRVSGVTATGRARFYSGFSRQFPNEFYTSERFPGLAR